jgi:hypothetical protein
MLGMDKPMPFERIAHEGTNHRGSLYRARVPDGWLVLYERADGHCAITFVPDAGAAWEIKKEH